jgi:hypothetical protein
MAAVRTSAGEATLRLAWHDLAGVPAGAAQTARAEIQTVLSAARVQVQWTAPAALIVILVEAEPARFHLPAGTMGVSRPGAGAVWILYTSVAQTLGRSTSAAALGRGLGRVVAHEIVHALASDGHATHGLMQGRLGRDALLATGIEWDDQSRNALTLSLSRFAGDGSALNARPLVGSSPLPFAAIAGEGHALTEGAQDAQVAGGEIVQGQPGKPRVDGELASLEQHDRRLVDHLLMVEDAQACLLEDAHVLARPEPVVVHEAVPGQAAPLAVAEPQEMDGRNAGVVVGKHVGKVDQMDETSGRGEDAPRLGEKLP